jgi:deoxyxylulose-5-phosphate synthase
VNCLAILAQNIFINQAQGARVVYAGYYSGLCYHTDGKSHQSINDLSVMVGMPGLMVVDPASPNHAVAVAEWAVGTECSQSVYVRLRRTPCPAVDRVFDAAATGLHPVHDLVVIPAPPPHAERSEFVFVTIGALATELALECQSGWASGARVVVVPALSPATPLASWHDALFSDGAVTTIITVEDDTGALRSHVAQRLLECHSEIVTRAPAAHVRLPRLVSKVITGVGPSFRSRPACLESFAFTAAALQALVNGKTATHS